MPGGWGRRFLDVLFPRQCQACGQALPSGWSRQICALCWTLLERFRLPVCPRCGEPFASPHAVVASPGHRCERCRTRRHSFDRARSVGLYHGRMQRLVHAYKYDGKTVLARDFAELMVEELASFFDEVKAGCVCHVPLHPARAARREFDQAALLANHLADRLHLVHAAAALVRVRDTPSQADLDRNLRRKNVREAFRASVLGPARGASLLLVDDVMTTGATVDECARTLKRAGAAAVHVVTVARSVPHLVGPTQPGEVH